MKSMLGWMDASHDGKEGQGFLTWISFTMIDTSIFLYITLQ